jgi:hypothetical protein
MKVKALLFAFALAVNPAMAATPATGENCPNEMKAIDDALPNVKQRTAADMNEIKRLRTEGEKLHNEGKHTEAMAALGKAKQMIGIK